TTMGPPSRRACVDRRASAEALSRSRERRVSGADAVRRERIGSLAKQGRQRYLCVAALRRAECACRNPRAEGPFPADRSHRSCAAALSPGDGHLQRTRLHASAERHAEPGGAQEKSTMTAQHVAALVDLAVAR